MTHDYNIRGKKEAGTFEDALKSIEDNLQESISGLRDDILNIKDVIVQRLQEDNLKLKEGVSCLEHEVVKLEIQNNSLQQYKSRRGNLEIDGVPTSISDDKLEKTVFGILNSINVNLDSSDVETCHRIGRSKDGKPKKTIIRIVNCKFCNKALLNKKIILKCYKRNWNSVKK